MSLVNAVRDKVIEYGIKIYNDYGVEENEYVFFVEDMILFINEKEKTIGVSFQATTKPDRVGSLTLILDQLKTDINIMDSFVFDTENRYISGDKAFKLIEAKQEEDVIREFLKKQTYQHMLLSADCHEC